ncbi:MAG: DUF4167 domain-containing protein [Rhizobiales bacterium]|nr:DUF4167 domain-containing protein [Hyphomicrobiales bacterium]MBN9003010.1 DUF4167 domain-containing protein [Hyphomicrobiales bacterium]
MRNGQNNKRMRGRNNNNNNNNNRRGQNPMTRVFESNGPDIKIRGTASHIAEKYVQLARDARGSGDPVASENYYQHAEHYFRLIAAAQEQFRQNQPQQQQPRNDLDIADEGEEGGDGYSSFGAEPGFVPQQQPFPPRDNQHHQRDNQRDRPREQRFQPRDNEQPREQQQQPNERAYREQRAQPQPDYQSQPAMPPLDSGVDRLPSFITGGQSQAGNGFESNGQPSGQPSGDRFPPRRRRRPHGPRAEANAAPAAEEANSGNE